MLGKLFGSKARVKILKNFLLQPDKKYYIRQLARDLKLQVNSVRRELDNLEEFGLLKSYTSDEEIEQEPQNEQNEELQKLWQGKVVKKKISTQLEKNKYILNNSKKSQLKKYYQTNKDFILFEEVKALIIKSQILYEDDFIEKIKKIGNPRLFILSGFFVNKKKSKADILVVGKINKVKFKKLIKKLENELGRELNFVLMSSKDFKYRRDITDIFLYNILEEKKLIIIDKIGIGK